MKKYNSLQEFLQDVKREVLKASQDVKSNNTEQYKDAIQTEVYDKYKGEYGRHNTIKNAVESEIQDYGNNISITTKVNTEKLPCGRYVYGKYPFAYSLGKQYSQIYGYDARNYLLHIIEDGNAGNIFKKDGAFHDERKFYEKAKENIGNTYIDSLKEGLKRNGVVVK